jgi:riboflavin-specific deaminase-like protein
VQPMEPPAQAGGAPPQERPVTVKRLLPPGDPAPVREIVEGLGLLEHAALPSGRPYVVLNMISTVDGRATIAGRSGPIGDRADRELFRGLRTVVDGVIVGAGTVRAERYGPLIREPSARQLRHERGLSEEPVACIVSGRLSLPADLPLLTAAQGRVVIVTASEASLPELGQRVDYVRAARAGLLDLPAALAELHERFNVRTLLCEGGPHLNAHLLAAGVVDELFLTLAPKLAGGEEMSGEGLRILAGLEIEASGELELLAVLASESELFLRYGVRASTPERVSRETISKSSLAR